MPCFAPLTSPAGTAVAVIGAGFAGPGTALSPVERRDSDIVLLEAEVIGHGASRRHGGFVSEWRSNRAAPRAR